MYDAEESAAKKEREDANKLYDEADKEFETTLKAELGGLSANVSSNIQRGKPRKIGKNFGFFGFFRPTQKMGREGPKWGGDVFFRHTKPCRHFGQNGF